MAEVYPLRAPGEYAGSLCEVKKCHNYAQFAIQVFNDGAYKAQVSCGHHIAVIIKGSWIKNGKAVIVQEIPGNWYKSGQSLAAIDGEVVRTMAPRNRK